MTNRIKEIVLINLELTRKEKKYIMRYYAIPNLIKQQIIYKLGNGFYQIKKIGKFIKTKKVKI